MRRLHVRFGHPSVQRLHRHLQRSDHDIDLKLIEKLTKYCKQCQKHGKSPGRFKFILHDEYDFNYAIYIDGV